MPYCVGTDEAGYGPNLGPLVVSATVWHVPEALDAERLYDHLAPAITPSPRLASATSMAIADSKVLYSSGKSLRHLERGLLAALQVLDRRVTDWPSLWAALDGRCGQARRALPWYADYHCNLPVDVDANEIEGLATSLRAL